MSGDFLLHERLFRSDELLARLQALKVTLCGAGALGANLAENLARSGFAALKVIDRDRIEEHNLSTQPFLRSDVGSHKAKILTHQIYRAVGVEVEAVAKELDAGNVHKLLRGSELVVDCFDNTEARQRVTDYCAEKEIPCLHVGLAADFAEILWNEVYRVPNPSDQDLCDYPLARNLVMMAVAVAAEVMVAFVATGERRNLTLTLGDLRIADFA